MIVWASSISPLGSHCPLLRGLTGDTNSPVARAPSPLLSIPVSLPSLEHTSSHCWPQLSLWGKPVGPTLKNLRADWEASRQKAKEQVAVCHPETGLQSGQLSALLLLLVVEQTPNV